MAPSSGFLLVDKPLGVTSFDVVAALRGALGTRKVGHSGTLDPQASGLMLVGFGSATRLLSAFHSDKAYEVSIRLGASTDTDDAAGTFSARGQSREARETIRALAADPARISSVIASSLTGDIDQVPSSYSAVRVGGKHAYDLAREGKRVEIAARPVHVSRFEIQAPGPRLVDGSVIREELARSANPANACADDDEFLDFEAIVSCSEGTYVRSLARDLGRLLGVGGYVTALRRVRVGSLRVDDAVPAALTTRTFIGRDRQSHTRLKVRFDAEAVRSHVLMAADLVARSLPVVWIGSRQAHLLETGLAIRLGSAARTNPQAARVLAHPPLTGPSARKPSATLELGPTDGRVVAICGQTLIGVLENRGGHGLHPRTILDQSFVKFPPQEQSPSQEKK